MKKTQTTVPAETSEADKPKTTEEIAAEQKRKQQLQRLRRQSLRQTLRSVRLTAHAFGNCLDPCFYQCGGEPEEEEAAKKAQLEFYGADDDSNRFGRDQEYELLSLQQDFADTLDDTVSALFSLGLMHDEQIRTAAGLSSFEDEDEDDEEEPSGKDSVVTAAA